MKKLLTILLTIIAIQANAQFKYNDGKATANMDTLGTRNDTLFLRNRVTGGISYFIPETGETITTREKVATQISDSVADKLKAADTSLFVSTKYDDAVLDNKISKLSDLQVTQRYYLDLTASDISTYSQLVPDPLIYSGKDSTVTIDNNTVLIAAFATNLNKPNVDTIHTGQWSFRFFARISATTGENYIHFDVYKRDLGGTETFLFRTSTPNILVSTETEYLIQQIKPAISITPDDRLVIKVSAQTTGVAKTATFHYSNSEKFAFVQPPLTFSIPESDPKYCAEDSAYLKSNTRELLARTDTTQELISRTIYVSMPTDPQTPGDDINGDGSSLTPYATIGKAISTIKKIISTTITIQLDSGSFTVTEADYLALQQKEVSSLVQHYGDASKVPIIIQGTNVLVESITGSKDGSNPFKYNCTGVTWTTDEHEGRFAFQGSNYYPIESNTSSVLNIAYVPAGTFTGIYELQTTLNITSHTGNAMGLGNFSFKSFNSGYQKFRFKRLKFNLTAGNILIYNQSQASSISLQIIECSWIANIGKVVSFANTVGGGITWQQNFIKTTGTTQTNSLFDIIGNCNMTISNSVIKSTTADRNIAIRYGLSANGAVHNNIITNVFAAFQGLPDQIRYNQSNFYRSVSNLFYTGTGHQDQQIYLKEINTLYFENVTNLCYWVNEPILVFIQIDEHTGYTNVWNTLSLHKNRFIYPERNIFINIGGTFPEYQQNQSATLTDNSTDSISIGDMSYNRTITIDYNIVRSGVYRKGTFEILNDGTNILFDPGSYFPPTDIGVTLNGAYQSGGSNTIKLKWTTTSTGANATIKYDVRRQNF